MKVNVVSYTKNEGLEGSTYQASLRFIREGTETFRDFGSDRLRALNHSATVATTTGAGTKVIPNLGSAFTGEIAGVQYDAADDDAELESADFEEVIEQGEDGRDVCVMKVDLRWTPIGLTDITGISRNDPDTWYPEYDRQTRTIQEMRPLKFYGHMARSSIPAGPILEGNAALVNTAKVAKGVRVRYPKNALGNVVRPVTTVGAIAYVDSFVEYGTSYVDTGANLETRQEVVNNSDLTIRVAVGGLTTPYPVQVFYPEGTAKLESYNVSSRVHRFRNAATNAVIDVPYFIRRTQIAIKASGWTVNVPNVGMMCIDDNGAEVNCHVENGATRETIQLGADGKKLGGTALAGAMVYGRETSSFNGLLGTKAGNVITVA